MIVKINNVKWDQSFDQSNNLPTDNIYIVSKNEYKPSDILGGMMFCDVDHCNFEYIEELPVDSVKYTEDEEGNIIYIVDENLTRYKNLIV